MLRNLKNLFGVSPNENNILITTKILNHLKDGGYDVSTIEKAQNSFETYRIASVTGNTYSISDRIKKTPILGSIIPTFGGNGTGSYIHSGNPISKEQFSMSLRYLNQKGYFRTGEPPKRKKRSDPHALKLKDDPNNPENKLQRQWEKEDDARKRKLQDELRFKSEIEYEKKWLAREMEKNAMQSERNFQEYIAEHEKKLNEALEKFSLDKLFNENDAEEEKKQQIEYYKTILEERSFNPNTESRRMSIIKEVKDYAKKLHRLNELLDEFDKINVATQDKVSDKLKKRSEFYSLLGIESTDNDLLILAEQRTLIKDKMSLLKKNASLFPDYETNKNSKDDKKEQESETDKQDRILNEIKEIEKAQNTSPKSIFPFLSRRLPGFALTSLYNFNPYISRSSAPDSELSPSPDQAPAQAPVSKENYYKTLVKFAIKRNLSESISIFALEDEGKFKTHFIEKIYLDQELKEDIKSECENAFKSISHYDLNNAYLEELQSRSQAIKAKHNDFSDQFISSINDCVTTKNMTISDFTKTSKNRNQFKGVLLNYFRSDSDEREIVKGLNDGGVKDLIEMVCLKKEQSNLKLIIEEQNTKKKQQEEKEKALFDKFKIEFALQEAISAATKQDLFEVFFNAKLIGNYSLKFDSESKALKVDDNETYDMNKTVTKDFYRKLIDALYEKLNDDSQILKHVTEKDGVCTMSFKDYNVEINGTRISLVHNDKKIDIDLDKEKFESMFTRKKEEYYKKCQSLETEILKTNCISFERETTTNQVLELKKDSDYSYIIEMNSGDSKMKVTKVNGSNKEKVSVYDEEKMREIFYKQRERCLLNDLFKPTDRMSDKGLSIDRLSCMSDLKVSRYNESSWRRNSSDNRRIEVTKEYRVGSNEVYFVNRGKEYKISYNSDRKIYQLFEKEQKIPKPLSNPENNLLNKLIEKIYTEKKKDQDRLEKESERIANDCKQRQEAKMSRARGRGGR